LYSYQPGLDLTVPVILSLPALGEVNDNEIGKYGTIQALSLDFLRFPIMIRRACLRMAMSHL
jgi:hypothetical protein